MKVARSRALSVVVATALLTSCSNTVGHTSSSSSPTLVSTSTVAVAGDATDVVVADRCTPNDTDGTVTIWHTLGGNAAGDVILQLEADFNASHRAQLHTEHVGGEPELMERLAKTPFTDWPDVVVSSERATRSLLDTEHFLAPESCDASSGADLLPLARSTYTVDSQLAALPWGLSAPVLVFNAAKFARAGLDVSAPPDTLEELLDASAKITQSGASPYGLVLSDSCGSTVLEQYAAKRGVIEGAPDNGHTNRNVTVDFATPASIADLTAIRDGVRDGHVLFIGGNGSGLDDLVQVSAPDTGGAMTIHTSAALGDIIDLLASGNFPGAELGVGPLPGPAPGSLVGGNALWLVDHDDANRAGRAWTVLDWLYEPDHLARLAAETGYVPPTRSALTERVLLDRWAEHPQLRVAYDQLLATPVGVATTGMMIGPSSDRDSILFGTCTRAMEAGADIESALREASRLVNDVIATYESDRSDRGAIGALPSTSSPTVATRSSDVSGVVSCVSGADVVGVWIDAESGGSGFAERSDGDGHSQHYTFRLANGGRYRVKVGCGGSEAEWATTNSSGFVSSLDGSFRCHDSGADDPLLATCEQA